MRYLCLTFDLPLHYRQVSAFRGAIIRRVGQERRLFHQHRSLPGEPPAYRHRYPLVQYKRIGKNATILALNEAVDQMHHIFQQPEVLTIDLQGKTFPLRIQDLTLKEYSLKPHPKPRRYRLRNWLGLADEENFQQFEQAQGLVEQVGLLESILTAQAAAFQSEFLGKDRPAFSLHIQEVIARYPILYKKLTFTAFDLTFSTTAFLPPFIGLGKGSSKGFGMVRRC